jgi:competence protein ComEC
MSRDPASTKTPHLRSERHRAPLLWLLIPFAAGITAGKMLPASPPAGALLAPALALALAALAAVFVLRRHAPALAAIAAALFFAGAADYEIHRARLAAWDGLPPREARLTLRIDSIAQQGPAARARPSINGLARVVASDDPHLGELAGQPVYFSLDPPASPDVAAQVIRSAEIKTVGTLESLPRNAGADSFEGHLVAAGMNFRLDGGRVNAIAKPPAAAARFFERMRARFSGTLGLGLQDRPRETGIYRAMVLGQKHEIDSEQTSIFLGSGTMHLFAISGIHIVVIATGMHFLLLLLRLPRWPRYLAGTAALWTYVQITGASPSAVRAFTMVAILQTALMVRLPVNGIATLAFAALAMLVAGPMQLFSASFQMSYGIVAAILLYGLPLGETWNARWELFRDVPRVAWTRAQHALSTAHRYFLGVLAISVSASLVSAFCSVVYFRLVTPGALFANLILIPAASLVILSGFLSLICGLAGLAPLCAVFNHAAALLLVAMQKLLALAVKIPGVSRSAHFFPEWLGTLALAALLGALLYGYSQKWALRRGGFWPPAALVIVVLVALVHYD